jgi:LysM repeat protein
LWKIITLCFRESQRRIDMRKVVFMVGLIFLLQVVWVAPSLAAPPAEEGLWHTVQRGETLASIGRLYGVNPYAICSANNLSNCNIIWAGQVLWIPQVTIPPQRRCIAFHTVSKGQTLYSIARFYGVSPWAIAAANRIYNLNLIFAGQTLCIPDH